MIKDLINKHCGENHKYIIMCGFVLCFLMLIFTMLFTYHSFLHYIALGFQLLFFGFNVLLFFLFKNKNFNFLVFIIPFIISIAISFLLNGYNSNYNTLATEFVIYISIIYFSLNIPIKKDCFTLLILSLFVFVFYFILLYFKDFITLLKTRDFSEVRFGEKIAPLNMITIYFDLACSLSFVGILEHFKNKRIKYSLLFLLFYVISFGCGILIGSKQFIVVTLLVNLILLIWFFGKKKWYISVIILASSVGLAVLLLNTTQAFSTIADRFKVMFDFFTKKNGRDFSSASRLTMFTEAIYLFTKRPLFGYGAGGYALYGSYGTYSHNTISNLLCEFGAVGFIMFLFYVFGPWLCRTQQEDRDFTHERYIWAMLFCLMFQALFGVLYLHKLTFVIAAICYIAFAENKNTSIVTLFNIEKKKDAIKTES